MGGRGVKVPQYPSLRNLSPYFVCFFFFISVFFYSVAPGQFWFMGGLMWHDFKGLCKLKMLSVSCILCVWRGVKEYIMEGVGYGHALCR